MFGVWWCCRQDSLSSPPLQARLPVVTRAVHKKQNAGAGRAGTTKALSEDR